jgi:hypothetical protein
MTPGYNPKSLQDLTGKVILENNIPYNNILPKIF